MFIKHLVHAVHGLIHVWRTEMSFRLQVLAAAIVVVFMFVFPLVVWQRVVILLLIAAVLILEILNSVTERLLDAFKPRLHPTVAEIKDMMAGAVLVSSLISVIVGFMIFWPYV